MKEYITLSQEALALWHKNGYKNKNVKTGVLDKVYHIISIII